MERKSGNRFPRRIPLRIIRNDHVRDFGSVQSDVIVIEDPRLSLLRDERKKKNGRDGEGDACGQNSHGLGRKAGTEAGIGDVRRLHLDHHPHHCRIVHPCNAEPQHHGGGKDRRTLRAAREKP